MSRTWMDRRQALALLALGASGCGSQTTTLSPAAASTAAVSDGEGILTESKNDKVKKCVKAFVKAMEG